MTIKPRAVEGGLFSRTVLAVALLTVLSGCTATAWSETVKINSAPPMPVECLGWERIDLKQRTAMTLLRDDPRLAIDIDAHNLKGRNLGCWD